jgi:hypothetical protein
MRSKSIIVFVGPISYQLSLVQFMWEGFRVERAGLRAPKFMVW